MAKKASDAEGRALLERLAANPNYTALAWAEIGWALHNRDNDMRAALAAAEKSIAAKPYWHNLGLKAQIAALWLGDLDLALATLLRVPQAEQQEDWSVAARFLVLSMRRKPKEVLTFLNGVPQEWLSSAQFTGPKAFLTGLARRDDGAAEPAEGDFRRALDLLEKKLVALPNSPDLLALRAQCLKFLGDEVEAAKAYRVFRKLGKGSHWDPFPLFEPRDQVFAWLENEKFFAAQLRLYPMLDPWRDDPRFAALQAKADADPMLSPNAPLPPGAEGQKGGEKSVGK